MILAPFWGANSLPSLNCTFSDFRALWFTWGAKFSRRSGIAAAANASWVWSHGLVLVFGCWRRHLAVWGRGRNIWTEGTGIKIELICQFCQGKKCVLTIFFFIRITNKVSSQFTSSTSTCIDREKKYLLAKWLLGQIMNPQDTFGLKKCIKWNTKAVTLGRLGYVCYLESLKKDPISPFCSIHFHPRI